MLQKLLNVMHMHVRQKNTRVNNIKSRQLSERKLKCHNKRSIKIMGLIREQAECIEKRCGIL